MQENEINVLWKAHFVDRQVQSAVKEFFSATPDPSLIRLLGKKLPSLSPKDIRTSLQRASISFDFPVKPSPDASQNKPPADGRSKAARRGSKKSPSKGKFAKLGIAKSEVLSVLINRGLLQQNAELSSEYMGRSLTARITKAGHVEFRGATYLSPSAAGAAAKQSVSGKFMATDGWSFWHYKDAAGQLVPIKTARQRFLELNNS